MAGRPSCSGSGSPRQRRATKARVNGMKPSGYTLITGGAGFIGSNLAHRIMEQEQPVLIFDSLARPGAETNLRWLREQHAKLMKVQIADIRNRTAIEEALSHATAVYHFAAQVAVTTSMI